ncbi:hypothetical protein PR202_gb08429 [Eleusine coracana subsp. coracana]|uniref:Wax synthase domain-containing protein n=1 Tax=Eleusine coracana subsp. coracana TaxID=191504 RepID=A0AAV5EC73_ELECO|nr:hypothetical protein QOZ80_2BG0185140 [Eleusine coracana subsp. coracana]GJN20984.1 hypothetical protein PR202_gb08429 [Eleusine coracana subsp. coracana]
MHHSLVTVPAATAGAMLYARSAAASIRPGPRRLLALAPALALLLALPFSIPLYSARGTAAFFLVWLGEFKLLLLASGRGPLDPSLPPLPFVFTASLPVKLLLLHNTNETKKRPASDDPKTKTKTQAAALPLLSSSAIKLGAMVAILHLLRGKKDAMHPHVASAVYAVFIYCNLDFLLPCLAALGRAVLGLEMEPQFDRPYLSASLQDFWGRRWNLMASAVLRASVYGPVRARTGSAAAAVLATFLASGIMHEVVVYYVTFRPPTGRVTLFFALHGASLCAEKWWCARRGVSVRLLPRAVATPLVLAYVAGTAFWLFFPPLFGDGMDDRYIQEFTGMMSSVADTGGRLLPRLG